MSNKISLIDIIFENQIETKENYAFRQGLSHSEFLAVLAKNLGVDAKFVSAAIAKDVSTISKNLASKSKAFIKNSDAKTLKALGNQVPEQIKNISKELAIKKLYDATQQGKKALSRAEVKAIVDGVKSETKIAFKDLQIGAKSTGTAGKNVSNAGKNTANAGKNAKNNTSLTTKVVKLKDRIKSAGNGIINIVKPVAKRMAFWKLMPWKTFLSLCILGYVSWEIWDAIYGDTEPSDPDTNDAKNEDDWVKCILIPLSDDEGASLTEYGGRACLKYTKTGNTTYDSKGGLLFFPDGEVLYSDGSRKGFWSCGTNNINESKMINEAEVNGNTINIAINSLDDNLSGDFFEGDTTDMKDVLNILKKLQGTTYKGEDSIEVIKKSYVRVVGTDLVNDVKNNLTNLDFTGLEAQTEVLGILGVSAKGPERRKDGDSDNSGNDSNPTTGLSGITITWEDNSEDNNDGKKVGGVTYSPCNSFPFTLGCINDKVKDVQDCLGVKIDGYLGPITMKAIEDLSHFAGMDKQMLTQEIYDKIITACKSEKPKEKVVSVVDKLDLKPLALIPLPALDPIRMINLHGIETLEDQINKTVDGVKIKNLIDDKVTYSAGRYVLKNDKELTPDQLTILNRYMSSKGFYLDKKKETMDSGKYVWKTDNNTKRKIARLEKKINKKQDKIDDIKNEK